MKRNEHSMQKCLCPAAATCPIMKKNMCAQVVPSFSSCDIVKTSGGMMEKDGVKYRDLARTLEAEIRSGKYAQKMLPSEMQLVRRFGVGRKTVQRALLELQYIGLVVRCHGKGTFLTKMAQGLGGAIGLVLPISRGEIFPPICQKITALAQDAGYSVVLADIGAADFGKRVDQIRKAAKNFIDMNVIGVIYHPIDGIADAKKINQVALGIFSQSGMPLVMVDCDSELYPKRSRYDVVGADDFDAGYKIAEHLIEQGARKIVFCRPKHAGASHVNRSRGVAAAVEAHGVSLAVAELYAAEKQSIRKILATEKPDAFVCGNDRYAALVMGTLKTFGKRVPEDYLLAGFDDVNYAHLTSPSLTSAHQPCEKIGQLAFETLLNRVKNPNSPLQTISLEARIMLRRSTEREGDAQ